MSEKRLVRLYIGGTMSPELARTLLDKIREWNNKRSRSILDGYWDDPPETVEELIKYATENKWLELKEEEAIQGSEGGLYGLENWLEERHVPYDEHMPPFGELPGVIHYYRPPQIRASRSCDFFGNPIVEWEEVRKVQTWLQGNRAYKGARDMLKHILGPDVEELPHLKVRE